MSKIIINKNNEISINKLAVLKKNRAITATYYALYAENSHRQKALVSITVGDERVSTLKEYRRELMKKLNSILRRKAYHDKKVQYFSNIELGRDEGSLSKLFNPHLHIQFFYDDITPIQEALEYMDEKYELTNSDIITQEKEDAHFDYVIKDYQAKNYNKTLETNKKNLYYNQTFYTCSRKAISNYVIKFLYKYLATRVSQQWNRLKSHERYEFILEQIKNGNIAIVRKNDNPPPHYFIYKNSAINVKLAKIKKLCKTSQ